VAWRVSNFNDVMRRITGFKVLICAGGIEACLASMACYGLDLIALRYAVTGNGGAPELGFEADKVLPVICTSTTWNQVVWTEAYFLKTSITRGSYCPRHSFP